MMTLMETRERATPSSRSCRVELGSGGETTSPTSCCFHTCFLAKGQTDRQAAGPCPALPCPRQSVLKEKRAAQALQRGSARSRRAVSTRGTTLLRMPARAGHAGSVTESLTLSWGVTVPRRCREELL